MDNQKKKRDDVRLSSSNNYTLYLKPTHYLNNPPLLILRTFSLLTQHKYWNKRLSVKVQEEREEETLLLPPPLLPFLPPLCVRVIACSLLTHLAFFLFSFSPASPLRPLQSRCRVYLGSFSIKGGCTDVLSLLLRGEKKRGRERGKEKESVRACEPTNDLTLPLPSGCRR